MEENKEINENLSGCFGVGMGMAIILLACLILAFCSCKPQQKIIEVEKWQHDTTTIVDTVHVIDTKFVHDSIYITNTVTEYVKDSTQTNVSWQHYTYDSNGNVSSMTNYNSSTQHGTTAHTATESASTSVSDNVAAHEETSSHSESSGHSEALQNKEQIKTGLTGWQKFIQVLGYICLVGIAIGIAFAGLRIYGKIQRL